jgi:chromosome segregation ATPase
MAALQQLQDINLRVTALIKQQQQLKTQAQNWENLYKEATDVQKKLIEQSTGNAKLNDSLTAEISKLKSGTAEWEHKHAALNEKHSIIATEYEKIKNQLQHTQNELQAMRVKEEQQLSMHFGSEKEQEHLRAITEDLKEQLLASQKLNEELQTALQAARITLVEEQAHANSVAQQKNNLEKEISLLKEKYQDQVSELHSRISLTEGLNEKLSGEAKKHQETMADVNLNKNDEQQTIAKLNTLIEELQARISTELAPENSLLNSRVEQLTAQVANMQFENELKKKTKTLAETTIPSNMVETVNQNSGSNEDQVHFLYAELQASQGRNAELEMKLESYIGLLSEDREKKASEPEELKNLQEQNKIVKLAEAIEGNTVASNVELKQKLNEMIKEVDRCIAKLSS